MILIKHIEFLEVQGDEHRILHEAEPWELLPAVDQDGPSATDVATIRSEYIRGKRFHRKGHTVVIGCTEQASGVIGIQYEAWDNLERALEASREARRDLTELLLLYKAATLWKRLKWLFTGVKP